MLFFIYKLYQWSKHSDPDTPMFGVTVGVVMFNVFFLFSLINIIYITANIDVLHYFFEVYKSKIEFIPAWIAWIGTHYFVLEKCNLKKAALERFSNKELPKHGSIYVLLAIVFNVMLFLVTTVIRLEN